MDFSIPFIRLHTREKAELFGPIMDGIRRLFESSQFILGADVEAFETRFSRAVGCAFAVGVNSGLDALLLSLRGAGIGRGDEVITVPNSFIASVSAIVLAGARPVLVDVGWDYNIDASLVERAITPRTRAILPVHLTGNPCAMEEIMEIAKRRSLCVIEDAAQAIGAAFDGKPVGSIGEFGCFSLHPLKNLHVWGDGGVITVKEAGRAEILRRQRNHGLIHRDESAFFSYNSRLDTLQAIVGLALFDILEGTTRERIRNASVYQERLAPLSDRITLPITAARAKPVFHVFQIRTSDRDELRNYLAGKGIETKIHYPVPIHLQPAAARLGYRRGDFPVTEKLAGEILSLPIRESLSVEEVHRVCDAIAAFYSG